MEVTKARKNAASATAAERNAYRDAIVAAGTTPTLVFFGGVSYWHKQQEVHFGGPSNRHGSPAFLPWHREFINRYEVLLPGWRSRVRRCGRFKNSSVMPDVRVTIRYAHLSPAHLREAVEGIEPAEESNRLRD